jgi:predicted dehydrogenase
LAYKHGQHPHCEITVAGLHAGKHVMCEKPMAKTTAEAQKMIDTGSEAILITYC